MDAKHMYDVIVVGCGASGVAALSRLAECNLQVLGLEADSRIGGRINSVQFGEGLIDLGAEWCHGEDNNIVYSIVRDHKVLKEPTGEHDITFIDSSGEFLTPELSMKFSGIWMEVANATNTKMVHSRRSLGEHFTEEYWQLINTKYSDVDKNLAADLLEWFQKYENSINASDTWFEASGRGHLEYWECEGNSQLHWQGKGYKTLLDIMLGRYPDSEKELPVEILFDKTVSKIDWSTGYFGYEKAEDYVKVTCKDGTEYHTKFVIVTVSIGVLQEHYVTMFYPSLPNNKVNSILGLTLGTVDKIFVMFEKPWWDETFKWVGFVWKGDDRSIFVGGDAWLLEIFGVNTSEHNPNILCGWLSGSAARHMETLDIDTVQDGFHRLLCHFLGKQYTIPLPAKIKRSAWFSNPHTRGSYTFRSMLSEEMQARAQQLACPVFNVSGAPVLCFGGEATSTHYFSTVHGAVEAGYREANRLIKYIKNTDKEYASVSAERIILNTTRNQVVIIGAGIAGLAAARACMKRGINDILILEAKSRIGGRIQSVEIMDGFVEFGAQWLHGDNNELYDLANEHHLLSKTPSFEGEGKFLRNDGYTYNEEFLKKVDGVVTNILRECEEFTKLEEECSFSVGEYLNTEFEKYISMNLMYDDEIPRWREVFAWHVRFHEIDNSCDALEMLSAKAWGSYDFNGGNSQNHISFVNGYSSVLDKIVGALPKGCIKLNAPVSQILWNNAKNKENYIEIYLENNACYQAKHVIVTIPLGVLKTSINMFVPHLPRKHLETIQSLGFSAIGKIYVQFEKKWWGDEKGFQFVWNSNWTDNDDNVFRKEGAEWLMNISGFDVLTVGPPNTLVGWVNTEGTYLLEYMALEKVKRDVVFALKQFTQKESLPPVISIHKTSWGSDPYTKGCYCNITMACDKVGVGPATLAQPILNAKKVPALLFAGEACHSSFFSTTHGAYLSGAEQANVLCDYILAMETDEKEKPETPKRELSKAGSSKAGTSKSGSLKSGSTKQGSAKPGSSKHGSAKPGSCRQGPSKRSTSQR